MHRESIESINGLCLCLPKVEKKPFSVYTFPLFFFLLFLNRNSYCVWTAVKDKKKHSRWMNAKDEHLVNAFDI